MHGPNFINQNSNKPLCDALASIALGCADFRKTNFIVSVLGFSDRVRFSVAFCSRGAFTARRCAVFRCQRGAALCPFPSLLSLSAFSNPSCHSAALAMRAQPAGGDSVGVSAHFGCGWPQKRRSTRPIVHLTRGTGKSP